MNTFNQTRKEKETALLKQHRRDEAIMQAIIELTENPISDDGKVYIGDVASYLSEGIATISVSVRRMNESNFAYRNHYLSLVPTNKTNPRYTISIAPVNVA